MEQDDEEPRDAPAFDLYCERWTHGTRHMTKVERCDYLDLLLHQWTEDGLPADLDMLARLVGYRKGSQISPLVLEKLPIAADGKRRNARLERERVKQRVRIRGKKKGAALTNAKRWGKRGGAGALPPDRDASWIESPGDADNESHSVSLSDPSATLERNDIDSPPPTTHHPPLGELAVSPSYPTRGAGWPSTEEQCRSQAVGMGVDPEYAATIWNEHEASGDYSRRNEHGEARPIFNFSAYLKFRWNCRSRKLDDAKAIEKTKAELRKQGAYGSNGSKPSSRDERGQRAGEIPSDVRVEKVKIYRLENA